jgi:hypothetical protein
MTIQVIEQTVYRFFYFLWYQNLGNSGLQCVCVLGGGIGDREEKWGRGVGTCFWRRVRYTLF